MTTVISVKFRRAGKTYFFSPGEETIKTGEHVIVETARGLEYGDVVQGNHEVDDSVIIPPLKEIIRPATPQDTAAEQENRRKETEAFRLCKEKIAQHGLDMKLISCEYTFDNSKVLFYFTSDGRVDFRELVKDLAGMFRTRIELRQVGVRDETKMLGGLGACGRPLCCASYLNDFVPVSIKMAKEQNLSLNPLKISGVCGRLMCCLKNEEEVYEELNRKLPGLGDVVEASDGTVGEVHSISILKQLVKVVVTLPGDEKEIREFSADDLTIRMKRKEKNRQRMEEHEEALRELEKLENSEKKEKTRARRQRKEKPEELPAEDSAGQQEEKREPRRADRRQTAREEKKDLKQDEPRERKPKERRDRKREEDPERKQDSGRKQDPERKQSGRQEETREGSREQDRTEKPDARRRRRRGGRREGSAEPNGQEAKQAEEGHGEG